jgi:hypothetical protein
MRQSFTETSTFPVRLRVNGQVEPALIRFANEDDVEYLQKITKQEPTPSSTEDQDRQEYAALISKFYILYEKSGNLIKDFDQLQKTIESKEGQNSDLFFTLILQKSEKLLGYAALRRTWKNTLKIEYLFTVPSKKEKKENKEKIKGVGSNLLFISIFLAEVIGAPMFWGECTASSHGFYKDQQGENFKFLEEIFYLEKSKYKSYLTTENPEHKLIS